MPFLHATSGLSRFARTLALAVGCAAALTAASEAALNDTLFPRVWTTGEGLPHNAVTSLLFDRAGYLWLATPGGLSRFDGIQFRETRLPFEFQSNGYNIRALASAGDGALIVATTSNKIVRVSGDELTEHPASAVTKTHSPMDLFSAADGSLWIYSTDGVLTRWTPDGAQIFGEEEGVDPFRGHATFVTAPNGELWIAAGGGLHVWRDGRLEPGPAELAGPVKIFPGKNGRLWLCTPQQLAHFDGSTVQTIFDGAELPWRKRLGALQELCEDAEGTLWIALDRDGLVAFAHGKFETVTLPYKNMLTVIADKMGSVWVGTNGGGLVQLRKKVYTIFDRKTGLPNDAGTGVSLDHTGRIWASLNNGGLARLTGDGAPEILRPAAGRDALYVCSTAFDAQGNAWIADSDGLFFAKPPYQLATKTDFPGTHISLVQHLPNGDVWVASRTHFGFFRQGGLKTFTEADGYSGNTIRCLAADGDRVVWAGTFNGELYRYDGTRLERFSVGQPVHDLVVTAPGQLWIASAAGLLVKAGDQFKLFNRSHGLADDLLIRMMSDERGAMWFGSRRGFFSVPLPELVDLAAGKIHQIASSPFGRGQGLDGITVLPNYYPSAARSPDGRLWFATSKGVVAIEPTASTSDEAPSVRLDEILLNDVRLPAGKNFTIPAGQQRIEFNFSSPNYVDSDRTRVRYKLDRADPTWTNANRERSAGYSGLKAGIYTFRVVAEDALRPERAATAAFTFEVLPPWWQTRWFYAVAIAAVGTAAYLAARRWSQRNLQRKLREAESASALERERMRIARDLHDDLGGSITAINLLVNRIAATPPLDRASALSLLEERTRALSSDLSNIVWMIEPRETTLGGLAQHLRRFATRLFHHSPIRLEEHVAIEPDTALAPDLQNHLFAIAKEALHNILKHAQPTLAKFEFVYDGHTLEMLIQDNGVGFDPSGAQASLGNGLRNIRARADEIGAECAVETAPGQGVRLTVRLAHAALPPASAS